MIESRPGPAFSPTDDDRAVGDLARTFAARAIAPYVRAWDREHRFPRELYAEATAAGLMGLTIPQRYGGSEVGTVAYSLAIEEIAKVDAGTAVTISVHSMVAGAIARLGSAEQCERYLPSLATGDAIAGFALTEPEAGSDAGSLRSRALRTPSGYRLTGRKQWCTNGSYAAVTMGMFRTGAEGPKGISAFLIDNATPGIVVERVTEKLGIHTSNTCDLAFDDVDVPATALLGDEGTGFSRAMAALASGRIGIAAQAVGILAACLDASVAFAREREAFGRPIAAFEGVSFKIARMATDLEAARLLVRRAAALYDAGLPFVTEASQAKLFASTAARAHASEAVQIHGGYGYTTEFPVERYYRDAKITEIYEGTSEIQQIVIARALLGRFD